MSGERLPSLRVQRNVGLVYVPSFQTKALMIPTIGSKYFRIIPSSCIDGLEGMFQES